MIKKLVSKIGIFTQKSTVFNGPLYFKDHIPSLYAQAHKGGVVISESSIKVHGLHTQRNDDGQHYFTVEFRF